MGYAGKVEDQIEAYDHAIHVVTTQPIPEAELRPSREEEARIEAFLVRFRREELVPMTEAPFAEHVDAARANLAEFRRWRDSGWAGTFDGTLVY